MDPKNIENIYKQTPLQQGMLFHTLSAPNSGVYFEQSSNLLENLDVAAYLRAWQKMIERHTVLRTAFFWEDLDDPLQVVYKQAEMPVEQFDWREMTAVAQKEAFEAYKIADRQKGFDLSQAPLMRLALFRVTDTTYWMVWAFHHMVMDGLSSILLGNELTRWYTAFKEKRPLTLPKPRPFQDYVTWLEKRESQDAERFWRQKLASYQSPTTLFIDRDPTTPLKLTADYGKNVITLPPALGQAIQSFTRQHHMTLNTFMQAGWAFVMSRYSGESQVLFGQTTHGRPVELTGFESMIGLFITTSAVPISVPREGTVLAWLNSLKNELAELQKYEHTPLTQVHGFSPIPRSQPLFHTLLIHQSYPDLGPSSESDENLTRFERTNYPLTIMINSNNSGYIRLNTSYNRERFGDEAMNALLIHWQEVLQQMVQNPERPINQLTLLPLAERQKVTHTWNATAVPYTPALLPDLFSAQVQRTPNAPALVAHDETLTYQSLNERANQLAHHLQKLGVRPDTPVAICMERSAAMMVALLGILKAGGAYVPLDPAYPANRLEYILQDVGASLLVTQSDLALRFAHSGVTAVCLDTDKATIASQPRTNPVSALLPDHLAYIIYTSGSTGKPKGVGVPHRQLHNFFTGIDGYLGKPAEQKTWLALTSISFDISVLELFWTLVSGFKVVLQTAPLAQNATAVASATRPISFSLFYFASEDPNMAIADRYRLLFAGAQFADEHNFEAIWTPERHFHAFGGLYPNPSVISAAIAVQTKHLKIRAGSVVLPLHNPVRVAEEWSLVDNLSQGRVGISFASGWHADDFVFAPQNYAQRHKVMYDGIETVRHLWRGETLTQTGGLGQETAVHLSPKPIQAELPFWVTAAGSPETFKSAGKIGANLLTHLLGQSTDELAEKIKLYHQAWQENGHPGSGHVTLMLHTFLSDNLDHVRRQAHGPFKEYLRSSADLVRNLVKAANPQGAAGPSAQDLEAILNHAVERYFQTSGLFGTPTSCLEMVNKVRAIGVDEIACLVDFGIPADEVIANFKYIDQLRLLSQPKAATAVQGESIPSQLTKHQVSHMQCTPSTLQLLALDPSAMSQLSGLSHLLLGGEALPASLVTAVRQVTASQIHNMYGPTETTIWSMSHLTQGDESLVPIGKPLANTQIYLLDAQHQLVPPGLPGELFIGGDGVVRGYMGRPSLTAERFLPDSFSGKAGARLYRTGDLARYRPDGTIEFLGRLDFQVKLRGFRIELGEIEAVLNEQTAVQESVVIVRHDTADDARLVAYIIPKTTPLPDLRPALKERLPEHMLPSAYVTLTAFPLTPNGKIDRKALPAPDEAERTVSSAYVAPRNDIEQQLVDILQPLLRVSQIGIHDNFFDLGGHSLLATQFISKVKKSFGLDLPIGRFFTEPTVAAFAKMIAELQVGDNVSEDELAALLAEVDDLSDDELQQLLAE